MSRTLYTNIHINTLTPAYPHTGQITEEKVKANYLRASQTGLRSETRNDLNCVTRSIVERPTSRRYKSVCESSE